MNTTKDRKDLIKEHIDKMRCIDDAFPLLKSLFDGHGIAYVRLICKEQLDKVDKETVDKIFWKQTPIDSILPLDAIQEFLSFVPYSDMNLVSKQFKDLNEKIHIQREKKRQIAVEQEFENFIPDITSDKTDKTWIVRKSGPLSDEENEQGFVLANTFDFALSNCTSGDVIRIEGAHRSSTSRIHRLNICICGDESVEEAPSIQFRNVLCVTNCKWYLKDIELHSPLVFRNGSMWIENCILSKKIAFKRANLHIRDCDLNKEASIIVGGNQSTARRVDIVNCVFQDGHDYQQACIRIRSAHATESSLGKVSLKCIGNIFRNKGGYPIMDDEEPNDSILDFEQSIVAHNVLRERNVVDDPDKIYELYDEPDEDEMEDE